MAYTFLDFGKEVLQIAKQPLTYQEIWEQGVQAGLDKKVRVSGKTPWQTLGARLYVDVRDNDKSEFVKVSRNPARFFLRSRMTEIPKDIETSSDDRQKSKKPHFAFEERALHPLVSYFAYANLTFNRGKSIFTKTIYHEKSKKDGLSEWTNPDMVGFYLPLVDWEEELIELNKISDNSSLKIYSFELKRMLNRGNYREAFFQAVSNSSWAHEGYLVAADLQEDDDLLSELERLSMSFGIGIVELELEDIDSSRILFPARVRESLDWETMNKLCEQNADFKKFVQDIKIDFESKRIHRSEYDPIIEDPDEYAAKLLKQVE